MIHTFLLTNIQHVGELKKTTIKTIKKFFTSIAEISIAEIFFKVMIL